ncbi:DUF992 domain-containing protein [Brucella intermedia]|uniref:DUF992 domain-containing protein n=1 Tax=Brucella intermedia TaxID=94625 RepID=UPI00124D9BE6|nr:DUF992 domain-containing protein [Brucella intermedia]KAB2721500.1 DUF992 domain-containing protein [Brucella intermedia]
MKRIRLLLSFCAILWASQAVAETGFPNRGTDSAVGVLRCNIESGVGLILGSSRAVTCQFKHSNGSVEAYKGTISKLGLDLGVTSSSTMLWAVIPTAVNKSSAYALEGNYVGVTGSVALGLGLGTNILIGGSNKNFALQPLSIEASQGVNIALGIGKLHLQRLPRNENPKKKK